MYFLQLAENFDAQAALLWGLPVPPGPGAGLEHAHTGEIVPLLRRHF
jgi:hypothetical protein